MKALKTIQGCPAYLTPSLETLSQMPSGILCTSDPENPTALEGGDAGEFEENEW